MGKYNQLKYLKKTRARVHHLCSYCGETIFPREYYYKEAIRDKFLQFLHAKSFCIKCYEQHGEALLTMKVRKTVIPEAVSRKLNIYFGKKDKNEKKS